MESLHTCANISNQVPYVLREEDFLARQFILAEADRYGNSVRGSILNDIPHIDNARDLVS